jgi:protein phosphatase
MSFVRRLLGRKDEKIEETTNMPSRDETQPQAGPEVFEDSEPLTPVDPSAQSRLERHDHPPSVGPVAQAVESLSDLAESSGLRVTPQPPGLHVGYASDVGQLRDHNEDTLLAFKGVHLGDEASDPFGFFVVSDGMGGHRAGEVASSLAARLVSHHVLSRVYSRLLLDETADADPVPLTDILRDAVQKANARVHEKVPGAGTTLTCALILGRRAYIAHVGDSRAYLLTKYDMHQVTEDHSYVSRLIELGELSPEEAAVHPQRHVLYRAIGQGDKLDIDTYHQSLPPGSRLLLCSDGLSGTVSEADIGRIIASATTPQEACQKLVKAANDAGGPDNITAVLIEIPSD